LDAIRFGAVAVESQREEHQIAVEIFLNELNEMPHHIGLATTSAYPLKFQDTPEWPALGD